MNDSAGGSEALSVGGVSCLPQTKGASGLEVAAGAMKEQKDEGALGSA